MIEPSIFLGDTRDSAGPQPATALPPASTLECCGDGIVQQARPIRSAAESRWTEHPGRRGQLLVSEYLRTVIESTGATVVGPAADVERACDFARTGGLHGAVLDLQLGDDVAEPLMNELDSQPVPFVVISGFEQSSVPQRFAGMSCVAKPIARGRAYREGGGGN